MEQSLSRAVKPVELRDLYRRAEELGCRLSLSGGNHIRIDTPEQGVVFGPQTSSSHRAVLNMRSQLRRKGVAL